MILFFDSSALVKYFHEEPGTDVVTHMIANEENELYISELAKIEFFSALYRRFRNHEIREEILEQVLKSNWSKVIILLYWRVSEIRRITLATCSGLY